LVAILLSAPTKSFGSPVIVSHAPISIYNNNSFTQANGVTSGSGTRESPYIIENWVINASSANGIDIEGTTAYFIIRNCLIENGADDGYVGIYLNDVINGFFSETNTS
jgi:hypothetical protein